MPQPADRRDAVSASIAGRLHVIGPQATQREYRYRQTRHLLGKGRPTQSGTPRVTTCGEHRPQQRVVEPKRRRMLELRTRMAGGAYPLEVRPGLSLKKIRSRQMQPVSTDFARQARVGIEQQQPPMLAHACKRCTRKMRTHCARQAAFAHLHQAQPPCKRTFQRIELRISTDLSSVGDAHRARQT